MAIVHPAVAPVCGMVAAKARLVGMPPGLMVDEFRPFAWPARDGGRVSQWTWTVA